MFLEVEQKSGDINNCCTAHEERMLCISDTDAAPSERAGTCMRIYLPRVTVGGVEGRAAAGSGFSLTTDLVNLADRPCCSICSGGVFVTDMSPAAIPHAQEENANCEKKEKNRV